MPYRVETYPVDETGMVPYIIFYDDKVFMKGWHRGCREDTTKLGKALIRRKLLLSAGEIIRRHCEKSKKSKV